MILDRPNPSLSTIRTYYCLSLVSLVGGGSTGGFPTYASRALLLFLHTTSKVRLFFYGFFFSPTNCGFLSRGFNFGGSCLSAFGREPAERVAAAVSQPSMRSRPPNHAHRVSPARNAPTKSLDKYDREYRNGCEHQSWIMARPPDGRRLLVFINEATKNEGGWDGKENKREGTGAQKAGFSSRRISKQRGGGKIISCEGARGNFLLELDDSSSKPKNGLKKGSRIMFFPHHFHQPLKESTRKSHPAPH